MQVSKDQLRKVRAERGCNGLKTSQFTQLYKLAYLSYFSFQTPTFLLKNRVVLTAIAKVYFTNLTSFFSRKNFHQKSSHFFTTWKFHNLDYFILSILYFTNLTSLFSQKNFHQKSSHFFTTWKFHNLDYFTLSIYSIIPI